MGDVIKSRVFYAGGLIKPIEIDVKAGEVIYLGRISVNLFDVANKDQNFLQSFLSPDDRRIVRVNVFNDLSERKKLQLENNIGKGVESNLLKIGNNL